MRRCAIFLLALAVLTFSFGAYAEESFPGGAAPLVKVEEDTYILELFHGPTCAFKDMARQILPYLMTASAKKNNETENLKINIRIDSCSIEICKKDIS